MSKQLYITTFMNQVQIALEKNIPLKSSIDAFLDGASGGVSALSDGVDGASNGLSNLSGLIGGLAGVAAHVAAASATMGVGFGVAGGVIGGLKVAVSGYRMLERQMGRPSPPVFLPCERTAKMDKLRFQILFGEIALKLSTEYSYFIEHVATEDGVEALARFAAKHVMTQWLILTRDNTPITLDSLCHTLFTQESVLITDIEVNSQYKKSGSRAIQKVKEYFLGPYSAENIYSRPILVQSRIDRHVHLYRYQSDNIAGPHAYRVISQNTNIVPTEDYTETPFVDQSKVSSHFQVEYLINSEQTRKVIVAYLQSVQEDDNLISLNEYLSKRFKIKLIASCHDNTLAGLDLSNGDFSGVYFNRADLSGCQLEGTNWSNAYLQEAILGSSISVIGLKGSVWNNTHLECSKWTNVKLNTEMTNSDLRGGVFKQCRVDRFVHINCLWDLSDWQDSAKELQENLEEWPKLSPSTKRSGHKNKPRELHGLFKEYEVAFRNTTLINTFTNYLEPHVLPFQGADVEAQPLSQKVDAFFANTDELLLIHGIVGSGKSSYVRKLQKKLWDEWTDENSWVPVLVEMKSIETKDKDFLSKYFVETCGYKQDQLPTLKYKYKFLIIFDGLDECKSATQRSIINDCRFQYDYREVKAILTSRTDFIVRHEAFYRNFEKYRKKEWFLTSITLDQRNQYLRRFFGEEAFGEYHDFVVSSKELVDIVISPLMLYILCTVLPKLKSTERTKPYTQSDLYSLFFEGWIQREIDKRECLLVVSDISNEELAQEFLHYAESLAFKMFSRNLRYCDVPNIMAGRRIFDETDSLRPDNNWNMFFNSSTREIQHICPLSVKQILVNDSRVLRYEFIHESFREYLAASFLWRKLEDIERDNKLSSVKVSRGIDSDYLQIRENKNIENWNKRYLIEEPGILKYLVERLINSDSRKNYESTLLNIVLLTRKRKDLDKAASSAITLLNKADYPLYNNRLLNNNMGNLKIPYADFDGAFIPRMSFKGTDLTGARFGNAMCLGTNFDETILTDTRFSPNQLMFVVKNKIKCFSVNPNKPDEIAYAVDGSIFFVRLSDGHTIECNRDAHKLPIKHLVFAPNGILASCDTEDNIYLWDNYQLFKTYIDVFKQVSCFAFSKDSKIIAVAAQEQYVYGVYLLNVLSSDIHTRKCYDIVMGEINSLAFSQDGEMLACGGLNTDIHIWQIYGLQQNPTHKKLLSGHQDIVTTLLFSEDNLILYSGSRDTKVCVWDIQNNSRAELKGHTSAITSLSLAPNGLFLASSSWDNTIRIWAIQSINKKSCCMKTLSGHSDLILNIAFKGDDKLISGSLDQTLRLWDLSQCGMRLDGSIINGHTRSVSALSHSPDGKYLASGGLDNIIYLWNNNGEFVKKLEKHTQPVICIAHAVDGKFASGSEDETIVLWSADGQYIDQLKTNARVECLVFSPDGKKLASSHWDKNIYIWNVDKPDAPVCQICISGHDSLVHGLAFNADSTRLISGGADKTIRLWSIEEERAETAQCLDQLSPPRRIKRSAASPSIARIKPRRDVLQVIRNIEQEIVLTRCNGSISSLAFSSVYNTLIVGDITGKVHIYRIDESGILKVCEHSESSDSVTTLILTSDGKTCLSGTKNETILWDLENLEQPIFRLPYGSCAYAFHDSCVSFGYKQAIYAYDLGKDLWVKIGPCVFWPEQSSFMNSYGIRQSTIDWLQKHGVAMDSILLADIHPGQQLPRIHNSLGQRNRLGLFDSVNTENGPKLGSVDHSYPYASGHVRDLSRCNGTINVAQHRRRVLDPLDLDRASSASDSCVLK